MSNLLQLCRLIGYGLFTRDWISTREWIALVQNHPFDKTCLVQHLPCGLTPIDLVFFTKPCLWAKRRSRLVRFLVSRLSPNDYALRTLVYQDRSSWQIRYMAKRDPWALTVSSVCLALAHDATPVDRRHCVELFLAQNPSSGSLAPDLDKTTLMTLVLPWAMYTPSQLLTFHRCMSNSQQAASWTSSLLEWPFEIRDMQFLTLCASTGLQWAWPCDISFSSSSDTYSAPLVRFAAAMIRLFPAQPGQVIPRWMRECANTDPFAARKWTIRQKSVRFHPILTVWNE